LRLLLDVGEDHVFSALPIDLGGKSLLHGLEASRRRILGLLTGAGEPSDLARLAATDMGQYASMLGSLVNLLLYISSVNAEVLEASGAGPRRPIPQTTRNGPRLFPPNKPAEWQVGYRLGAALRAAASRSNNRADGNEEQRSTPRAHIRRAHWHSYWTGPVNLVECRRLSAKWMPPIAVNIGRDDLPVPVVRSVKVPTNTSSS
jgi:hypothetical protein